MCRKRIVQCMDSCRRTSTPSFYCLAEDITDTRYTVILKRLETLQRELQNGDNSDNSELKRTKEGLQKYWILG